MKSVMARVALALLALTCVTSCSDSGQSDRPIRLRAVDGRLLTYDAHRVDDWPDPEYGYGGTLETLVRFRTMCVGASPRQRTATFDVRIVSVKIDAPTRFGMVIDTSTPEAPPGDLYGAEPIARKLLQRDHSLRLDDVGRATPEPVPDEQLRTELRKWAAPHSGIANAAMVLLDDSLDGPRFVARWYHACGLMLPAIESARSGSRWKFRTPPFASPAGQLSAEVTCTLTIENDAICTIDAVGAIRVLDETGKQLNFEGGQMTAQLVLDRVAGIVTRYHETMSIDYLRPDGQSAPTRWERTLTLVE